MSVTTNLAKPKSKCPANFYLRESDVVGGLKRLTSIRLTQIQREIRDEIEYILADDRPPVPWYHDKQVFWLGVTGHDILHQMFDIPLHVEGFHKCLQYVVLEMGGDVIAKGKEVQRIWQYVWDDAMLVRYPSPYAVFIRDMILNQLPPALKERYPLQVRETAIVVEKERSAVRLDRALLTPRQISKQMILNGLHLALLDVVTDKSRQKVTDERGNLSQGERAGFVVGMLILGSRFKGLALDNKIIPNDKLPWVWVSNLSKQKHPNVIAAAKRPLNLHLLPGDSDVERFNNFLFIFSTVRTKAMQITQERGDKTVEDTRATLNLLRKEVKTYMKQVFPGMLLPQEGTHLLRKIYLQLAFEEYGAGMKETGFAATVFAHEGYNTSLHYTSVTLV